MGPPYLYLDNPAGTQIPRSVMLAARDAMLTACANLGGFFATSRAAQAVVDRAHERCAQFLGADEAAEIVIGASMTALTFHFARSLARSWRPGDEIVVTQMDHDGNISPWLTAAQDCGASVRFVPFDRKTWCVEPHALAAAISERTRLVAFTYASNLSGSINDAAALCRVAKRNGALVYVDAVQLAPHRCIDVKALGCDFLACSSYKFFGPHLGIVWARRDLLDELYAYKVRPATDDLPWKFELGTPQIELLAALAATIDYFVDLEDPASNRAERARICSAFDAIAHWERALSQRLLAGLTAMDGVTVHGLTRPEELERRVPTISFTHSRRTPPEIARALADRNIFVWSGNNFGLEMVRALGLPEDEGVVRIGMAHYNTPDEIDAVLAALEDVL